jgi:hypothetical protein
MRSVRTEKPNSRNRSGSDSRTDSSSSTTDTSEGVVVIVCILNPTGFGKGFIDPALAAKMHQPAKGRLLCFSIGIDRDQYRVSIDTLVQ